MGDETSDLVGLSLVILSTQVICTGLVPLYMCQRLQRCYTLAIALGCGAISGRFCTYIFVVELEFLDTLEFGRQRIEFLPIFFFVFLAISAAAEADRLCFIDHKQACAEAQNGYTGRI